MTFEEVKEDRKQKYIFDTNFGYEGKELDLALSMYALGFDNGFSDLKKTIEQLEKQIEEMQEEINWYHSKDLRDDA